MILTYFNNSYKQYFAKVQQHRFSTIYTLINCDEVMAINPFTVKHILVECSDFTYIRNKYYTTTDVHTLFREVDSSKITEYLKEIKLFDKI